VYINTDVVPYNQTATRVLRREIPFGRSAHLQEFPDLCDHKVEKWCQLHDIRQSDIRWGQQGGFLCEFHEDGSITELGV
jgi:hypothetical protein